MTKEEREIFMEKYIEGNKAAWEDKYDPPNLEGRSTQMSCSLQIHASYKI